MTLWKKWVQYGSRPADSSSAIRWIAAVLLVWLVWQCFGIEAMRPPWEDETDFTLPATNWIQGLGFKLPQWDGFYSAEEGWRWHMPLFPLLSAGWQKCFGISLLSLRLFTLLPAAGVIATGALLCRRVAGQTSLQSLAGWLVLLATDKTLVSGGLNGRMELHALLLVLWSFCVVLQWRTRAAAFGAGLLLGAACSFHPFALFFGPALACLLWQSFPPEHRVGGFFRLLAGGAIPVLGCVLWFLSAWSLTRLQFLTSVRVSSASPLQGVADIYRTFLFCFRMQPVFQVTAVIATGLLGVQFVRKFFPEQKPWPRHVLMCALAGFILFLLRGSATHTYYYAVLAVLLYLILAWAARGIAESSRRVWQRGALAAMGLLLLNNLAFAAGKTYVVWDNRDLLDARPMNAFLGQQLGAANKILLPPNLWLYGSQHRRNYRLVFTPIFNLPDAVWTDYHDHLLAWEPEVIVLDKRMLPPHSPSLTPQQLIRAGYTRTGEFHRVFRHRREYSGYELEVYRKGPATRPSE